MKYLLCLSVFFLASCATMSKEECQTANWIEKGKIDGFEGRSNQRFSAYHKDCMKHGIVPNLEEYEKGRQLGLKSFCTMKNGEEFGRTGKSYLGVCPDDLEPSFLKGYNLGKKQYEIDQKERELEVREAELHRRQLIMQNSHQKCKSHSDCVISDNCSFSKCSKTGMSCNFSSDCKISGRCNSKGLCRYDR